MDFTELGSQLEQINDIVAKVPEKFQERCFEMLLQAALNETGRSGGNSAGSGATSQSHGNGSVNGNFSPDLQRFIKKYNVPEEKIGELISKDGNDIHFIRLPDSSKKATAQADYSLLIALGNALKNGVLQVSSDEVRAVVKAQNCYDEANFSSNFKNKRAYYNGPMTGDTQRRLLPEGEKKLSELIVELTA